MSIHHTVSHAPVYSKDLETRSLEECHAGNHTAGLPSDPAFYAPEDHGSPEPLQDDGSHPDFPMTPAELEQLFGSHRRFLERTAERMDTTSLEHAAKNPHRVNFGVSETLVAEVFSEELSRRNVVSPAA
jgi:hypothetical protein